MKKQNLRKILTSAFLITFSLNLTAYAVLDVTMEAKQSYEAYQEEQEELFGGRRAVMENRMEKVRNMLIESFESFESAEAEIARYEEELEPIQQKITTLKEQIESLDYLLDQSNTKITNIELLIAKREMDIEELMKNVEKSNIEMDSQKEMIRHYLQLSYQENQKYKTEDADKNLINLLLADQTVSETLQKEAYFSVMQDARRQIFYKLALAKNEFQDNQAKYNKMQKSLNNLQALVEKEKEILKEQQLAKEDLLVETEGKEAEYQRLLEESKKQQAESVFEIENLQDNLELIRSKLETFEEEEGKIIDQKTDDLEIIEREEYSLDLIDDESKTFFEWSVSPEGGITAYYHDPSYRQHFGVQHNAIDIRQSQGAPIFAPANGYVYKVQDNGMGYSYIILAHKDNMMTVYGHVSDFMVDEGDLVHTGDIIGLSGGMPGTKGAGWMTTGPHLHFEVYKDGEHVNPLDYLPLDELPIEYVPAEYLKQMNLEL